jgi:leader peptidase (prepilin peptidase) / N-methyltransferase
MMLALRKTQSRAGAFLSDALAWRAPERQYALVAWCLTGGAAWLVINFALDPQRLVTALAGLYLMAVLIAVCAIDARYGIIPDSLVLALAVGGAVQGGLHDQAELLPRTGEAILFMVGSSLFRAAYRWIRGYDGLGFGDVKFATAGVLWVGLEGAPMLLLTAVISALASLAILRADGCVLDGKQAIAFGPHLAVGLWVGWFVAQFNF